MNGKYKPNKKNGGIIPPLRDIRVKGVPIGCGNCMECRKKKAREWQVRLLEDVKHNTNGIMVTLTFSDKSISKLKRDVLKESIEEIKGYELDNRIATKAVRKFTERWRKKYKKTVRHWLVTELGHNGTENIHLHGIIWTNESVNEIRDKWGYGYIYPRNEDEEKVNYVSERTVNYIVKYIYKQDTKHKHYKSKILVSNGIGKSYIESKEAERNKYKANGETIETYKTRTGHEIAMPIYWRNKIYNEEEREKLWIEKLDTNERYIGGEKINIKNNEDEYYNLLKWYKAKSERLGYGKDVTDWNEKKYEEQRRDLLNEIREKKADAQESGLAGSKNPAKKASTEKILHK
nr:MAG: replication initiator protein [Microvirus sp.]